MRFKILSLSLLCFGLLAQAHAQEELEKSLGNWDGIEDSRYATELKF